MSPSMPNRAEPTPPTLGDPALNAERNSQIRANANMFGRAATILTSGTGVATPPTVQRKTLLGG